MQDMAEEVLGGRAAAQGGATEGVTVIPEPGRATQCLLHLAVHAP